MAKPRKIKKVAPGQPITQSAERILRTRLKEFYSHWAEPADEPTPEQLHNLRISGKRLRYSAEQLRELYPDRLALLIDLLKRSQDLLGEIQDCVTQRALFAAEKTRLEKRSSSKDEQTLLVKILGDYEQRQALLFVQFREIWQGMTLPEFRTSLKAMVTSPTITRKPKNDEPQQASAT